MKSHHRIIPIVFLTTALLGLAPSSPAEAQEGNSSEPNVLLTVKVGGLFPQVFNDLSTSYVLSFGGGWVLPALDRRLAVVVDGSYTRPEREETIDDPRLAGGSYSYTLIQHDLTFFVGAHYHFLDLRETFVPWAGLGMRVHLLESEIDGSSGDQAFGTNEETSTQFGAALRLGGGLQAGPGFVGLEIEMGFAPIDHLITGDSNIGNLAATLGYTLVL